MLRAVYLDGKAEEIAESSGAEYIIWLRRLNPEAEFSALENRKVYDNGSVAVYQMELGEAGK